MLTKYDYFEEEEKEEKVKLIKNRNNV